MVIIHKKGNAKIRAAMRQNEEYVLREIECNGSFAPSAAPYTLAMLKAVERLIKRGKIRFDQQRRGYVTVSD
jgi:hypothetical protein